MSTTTGSAQAIRPLANEFVTVFASPAPQKISIYSPGITRLDTGRLVATLDLGGPGMNDWPGIKGMRYGAPWQGKVYTSDDGGKKPTTEFQQ